MTAIFEEFNSLAVQFKSDVIANRSSFLRKPFSYFPSYFGFVSCYRDLFYMFLGGRDDGVALKNYYFGEYEPYSSKIWFHLSQTSRGILDCGAHTGYFSLLSAAANPASKIYAFEPSELNFSRLNLNKVLNGFEMIKPINSAVSDFDGFSKFFIPTAPNFHSSGGKMCPDDESSRVVKVTSLDSYFEIKKDIDLIKIDTEGAELSVLIGAKKIIEKSKPFILFEQLRSAVDFQKFFDERDYVVYIVDEHACRLIKADDFSFPISSAPELRNRLALHKSKAGIMLDFL